ncbi:MAG: hypothetical protein WDN25_03055 [Acetobacteraceae bacterium]
MGRRLAQPPTPRLAIPPAGNALLPDAASRHFSEALAAMLQAKEVPAFADMVRANDWRLLAVAEQRGQTVVPVYHVLNPKGEEKGSVEGSPVPTQAWASATFGLLDDAAGDAAPKITALLTAIQHADPNSLYNRLAKVQVAPVTGAPGDGNVALTQQMRTKLAALGPLVQDTAGGADFVVQGNVRMVPIAGGQQRVEIVWGVKNAGGDERGKVVQLNDIPAGSLDRYWADVAVVVATEAAGGVNDVITRQSGREPGEPVHGQAGTPLLEGRKPGVEPVR